MNPDERQMITGLFDRMRQQRMVEKDRDAEALIRDTVRQMPDAPYMLVQTVLVQEMALQNAQQQIEDLEDRMRALESQAARPQQSSGSFLGGLFGGGGNARPSAVPPSGQQSFGRQSGGFGPGAAQPARGGAPWGGAPGAAQQGGMAPMQQQAPAGGGFMKSAMATAAGVAGGMLAASAISSMMKGDQAQAGTNQPASSDTGNDPAGSYDAASDHNDPAGSYDDTAEAYDDGGSWGDE